MDLKPLRLQRTSLTSSSNKQDLPSTTNSLILRNPKVHYCVQEDPVVNHMTGLHLHSPICLMFILTFACYLQQKKVSKHDLARLFNQNLARTSFYLSPSPAYLFNLILLPLQSILGLVGSSSSC
ncbi:hypothetical protein L798_09509 [Zootermopsis nevadensis]|uniref:Uncharacterized protein n=1 Tax=Zootermopsis nevadensis TaxID=136037 RepID=A0A067RAE3_ZOONE|nr:hypothetical protein L798_09509 [Zootermopsis nevadensis]